MKYSIFLFCIVLTTCTLNAEIKKMEIINKFGDVLYSNDRAIDIQLLPNGVLVIEEDICLILDKRFKEVSKFKRTIKPYSKFSNNRIPFFDKANSKYGFIDVGNNPIIPPIYDVVNEFINGYAVVGTGDTSSPPPQNIDLQIIDKLGKKCSSFSSDYIELSKISKGKGVAYVDGKYCIIFLSDGIWKAQSSTCNYELLKQANQCVIYKNKDKYGLMSWEGKELTDASFLSIESPYLFSALLVTNKMNEKIIVDSSGKTIEVMGDISNIISDEYVAFYRNNKVGVYNFKTKKVQFEPIYDSVVSFKEDVFIITQEGRFSFIDLNGHFVSKKKYDYAYQFEGGIAIAGIKTTYK